MKNIALLFGSLSGLLSIILSTFNQHYYNKQNQIKSSINSFKIAINYQIYYTLLILILTLSLEIKNNLEKIILILFIIGIILFSGNIYLSYFKHNIHKKIKFLKFITPLGGIILTLAWLLLCIYSIIIWV